METLSITFSYESTLKISLLLVEVTPFDILIGVKVPSQTTISYESINPFAFTSLEDIVLNFLERFPEFQDINSAVVALPQNFLVFDQNAAPSSPFNAWKFDSSFFKKKTGFLNVFFVDRVTVIGKAVPMLLPNDFFVLSGQQAAYFNANKNTYMIALTDETYESSFFSFNEASKSWVSTKSLVNALELNTHNDALQNLLNVMSQDVSPSYPTLGFFFSAKGIEKLYATLYQENNMEDFIQRQIELTPAVIQKGAPTGVDSLELNDVITRSSLEGLDVSISAIAPTDPQVIKNAKSFLPLSLKNTVPISQDDLNWALLKALPFLTIIKGAFSYKKLPFQSNILFPMSSSNLQPILEKFCFDCLNTWSSLLGEALGQQALILNAQGGIFLAGRLLLLMKGLLRDLSLNSSFEKEISDQNSFTETSFALITNPMPSFLGMIVFFEEQEN
ncbi:MAG: glucokinase [Proteobacteria bacterium]|nr:glucokinase [Pseudomonadota bacterium]